MKNKYIEDGAIFINKAADRVKSAIPKNDVIEAILFLSLGIEKLLKGILYDVNPIYVYKKQEFENTAGVLYKSKIIPSNKEKREIAGKPDENVLTFKLSLQRAILFSNTISKHKSLLYSLSNWRDIIVHNLLSQLDIQKCKVLLFRDFFPFIEDFSEEAKLPLSLFLGNNQVKISSISAANQENLQDKVAAKLKSHKLKWEDKKSVPNYIAANKRKSENAKNAAESKKDVLVDLIDCPACGNTSVLTGKIDYDYSEGQVRPSGIFVESLQCFFCKLYIADYEEIDFLKLYDYFYPDEYDYL